MERRRFVPRSENLEARELLSGAGADVPIATTAVLDAPPEADSGAPVGVPAPEVYQTATPARVRETPSRPNNPTLPRARIAVNPSDPNIAPLRQFKIERLPGLLASVRPGRNVPTEIVSALQEDLTLISGTLVPPPSNSLFAFNLQLRSTLGRGSLSVQDAAALNRLFGLVLERAEAAPELIAQFQDDMNDLAHFNAQGPTPGLDTANDYALMLQTTLGVGIDFEAFQQRPRARPAAQTSLGTNSFFNR